MNQTGYRTRRGIRFPAKFFAVMAAIALVVLGAAPEDQATASSEAWLALIDTGKYVESWKISSSVFRAGVAEKKWTEMVKGIRTPLGAKASRKLKGVMFTKTLPGVPDGHYAVILFDTTYANKASATETLTMMDEGGQWKAAGYFIR